MTTEHYGIFDGRDENIGTKTPFVGNLPFDMEEILRLESVHGNDGLSSQMIFMIVTLIRCV